MTFRSFITLACKEAYQLLPILIVLFAIELIGIFDSFFSQSPDELAWFDFTIVLNSSEGASISNILFLIGIIIGYRLFSYEQQQRTQAFLWALPIARYQLFWAKFFSALCVMISYFTLSQLLSWWSQDFAVSTVGRNQFSWSLWWLELALINGILLIGLCYGILASYFRIAGIIILGIAWGVASTLASISEVLNFIPIGALLQSEFHGQEIILFKKSWIFHLILAGLCLTASLLCWTKRSEPIISSNKKTWIQSRFAIAFMYVIGFVIILAYMATSLLPNGGVNSQGQNQISQISTPEFLYSFYLGDQSAVINFIDRSAGISDSVQALLNSTIDQQIFVDATDDNSDHLGIAGWRRMRMNRRSLYIPSESKHIFTHEMTHVFADQIANRRLTEHSPYTQFFNEGLAEWVSYKVLTEEDLAAEHDALLLLAATSWKRLDMEFNDFLFASSFAQQFDASAIYAFGLAWIESLSTACGEQTPSKILHAMANPELSQRLRGRFFWQTILQESQCDLTFVNNQFATDMEKLESEIQNIPDIKGKPNRTEQSFTFTLNLDNVSASDSYNAILRIRDNAQTGPNGTHSFNVQLQGETPGEISIPLSIISGERFQYQIGVEFQVGERPFFRRWISDE